MKADAECLMLTYRSMFQRYISARETWVFKVDSEELFVAICEDLMARISRSIYEYRITYRPPHHMGEFGIVKSRKTNSSRSKRYLNLHTGGVRYEWRWWKTMREFITKRFYRFYVEANTSGVGAKGLGEYIIKCANDPNLDNFCESRRFKNHKNR